MLKSQASYRGKLQRLGRGVVQQEYGLETVETTEASSAAPSGGPSATPSGGSSAAPSGSSSAAPSGSSSAAPSGGSSAAPLFASPAAERNYLKVRDLLNEEANGKPILPFTDGPPDENVSLLHSNLFVPHIEFDFNTQQRQGKWNNPCCREILSRCLFQNKTSIGRLFTDEFGPPLKRELIAFAHALV